MFEQFPTRTFFFELAGDHSRLHDVYINSTDSDEKLQDELNNLVCDPETGKVVVTQLEVPTRDWTHFVKCGFLE